MQKRQFKLKLPLDVPTYVPSVTRKMDVFALSNIHKLADEALEIMDQQAREQEEKRQEEE